MLSLSLSLLLVPGCSTASATRGGATTLITIRDIDEVVEQIAQRLAQSSFMLRRDATSEPVALTMTRPVNYTQDVIRDGDRWTLIQSVMTNPMMQSMARERNVKLIIPREFYDTLRANSADARELAGERAPTHVLEGVLRTVTRGSGDARTDQYEATYSITALATGEVVWQDVFKIKRVAYGIQYN